MMKLDLNHMLSFLFDGEDEKLVETSMRHDPEAGRQLALARAVVAEICGKAGPGAAVTQRLRHAKNWLVPQDVKFAKSELLSDRLEPALFRAARAPSLDVVGETKRGPAVVVGKNESRVMAGGLAVHVGALGALAPETLVIDLSENIVEDWASAFALLWKGPSDIQRASFNDEGRAHLRWPGPGERKLRLDAGEHTALLVLQSRAESTT